MLANLFVLVECVLFNSQRLTKAHRETKSQRHSCLFVSDHVKAHVLMIGIVVWPTFYEVGHVCKMT